MEIVEPGEAIGVARLAALHMIVTSGFDAGEILVRMVQKGPEVVEGRGQDLLGKE